MRGLTLQIKTVSQRFFYLSKSNRVFLLENRVKKTLIIGEKLLKVYLYERVS